MPVRITDKVRQRSYVEEHNNFLNNASPEQKAMWERLKQIDNKPHHRAECMEIYAKLQAFLPPSERGGKYGLPVGADRDGDLEGLKVHTYRSFLY